MDSADLGLEYAPTVVPVWNDLSPSSPLLETLFEPRLPGGLEHALLFAFHNPDLVGNASSDGVVPLGSQLRGEAQAQATRVHGINASHTGILEHPDTLAAVQRVLERR